MGMFTDLAKKATTLSPIMEGRDKIAVADIIKYYPNGITINAIDMITTTDRFGEDSTYPVFTFVEDNTKFGFGGVVFKGIVVAWLNACDGDIESCNEQLKMEPGGGVKCMFSHSVTKNGNNVVNVQIV